MGFEVRNSGSIWFGLVACWVSLELSSYIAMIVWCVCWRIRKRNPRGSLAYPSLAGVVGSSLQAASQRMVAFEMGCFGKITIGTVFATFFTDLAIPYPDHQKPSCFEGSCCSQAPKVGTCRQNLESLGVLNSFDVNPRVKAVPTPATQRRSFSVRNGNSVEVVSTLPGLLGS